uniref:GDSL esterase/lipase n=1 Tax=Kalanchoe fedtschenkoi TaxID=63787 RepID=A0A7N0RIZ2_KALFE
MASRGSQTVSFLLFLSHMLLPQVAKCRAGISAVIVFGDSSVDAGNNNWYPTPLRSNFEPYGRDFFGGKPTGRFCNGRVGPDFISEALGLKPAVPAYLDPGYSIADFATGVNFASAGTGFDNATSDVLNVIPLWKEIENFKEYQQRLRAYLGEAKANRVLTEALYIVSLGTNDFLENYYTLPDRQSQYTVTEYGDFLLEQTQNFITEIYSLGVRKISLTSLPPMGCLPLERTVDLFQNFDCNEEYNRVAAEFNVKLKGLGIYLNQNLPGMKIYFSDLYYLFLQMIQEPATFGKLPHFIWIAMHHPFVSILPFLFICFHFYALLFIRNCG